MTTNITSPIHIATTLLAALMMLGLSTAPASAQPGQEDFPIAEVTDEWPTCGFGYDDAFYYPKPNTLTHREWLSLTLVSGSTFDVGFEADILIALNNDAVDNVYDLPVKYVVRALVDLPANGAMSFTALTVQNGKWLRPGKGVALYRLKNNGKLKRIKKARVYGDEIVIPDIRALDAPIACGSDWTDMQHLLALQMR